MKNAFRMISQGLRVKQSELRSKLGFSEPDDDDEVIGGAKPAAKTAEARNRAEPDDPYADLDEVEDGLFSDWEEVMGDVLEPVLALLEGASSYDEASKIIAESFPQLGDKAMIETLVKAAVKSRASGEAEDG
jgi:phage gp29-like protein